MFRKMRRYKQQLTDERVRGVLLNGKRGNFAVLGDDGYPYTFPVNYVYDAEDNCIYIHGAKEGHKVDAISRDNRASFNTYVETGLDEEGVAWYLDSVTAFGRFHQIEDDDQKRWVLRAVAAKYPVFDDPEDTIRQALPRCNCYRFEIEHMTGKHVHEK